MEGTGGDESTRRELHTRIRRLEGAVLVLALALVGAVTWAALESSDGHEVLTAERLEIVEPDGQPAFVLANSERPARGTYDGEVLMEGREAERAMPNFIFFDGHGDEVGGMLFGNRESGDGFSATRSVTLDGYRQDQTVQLFHRQNPEGTAAGLAVNDRPEDRSLRETFAGLGLEIPFTPEEADSAVAAALEEGRVEGVHELFGANRVFLGSDDRGEATLVLTDAEGRSRLVLGVPEDGDPYVRVLDEAGEAVAELP